MDYNNIILGTSSYDKVGTGNTVSVTGDGGNAWGYFGPSYKKLAPRLYTYLEYEKNLDSLKAMKYHLEEYKLYRSKIEEDYIRSYYYSRLAHITGYELLETLESKFGKDIILLCHENTSEFCHRRVLADFIELETGLYIPEVEFRDGKYHEVPSISYKDVLKKIM